MKKNTYWFTLIEILVVIALIWILIVGASNFSLNNNIDKQKSLWYAQEIQTHIERVRNQALLWKWFLSWSTIIHPQKWRVQIKANTGTGVVWYYQNGAIFSLYNDIQIKIPDHNAKISTLTCYNITRSGSGNSTVVDIDFVGNWITFSWCTSPNNKILDIETKYKNFSKIIRFHSISWVMEKVDQ